MRREQRDKLERQLQSQEEELRSELYRVLPSVAETGSPIFTNSIFNPNRILLEHLPAESEALLSASTACVELRERLGLEVGGSIGELFLAACRESATLDNAHRRGPRKLAQCLLGELRAIA